MTRDRDLKRYEDFAQISQRAREIKASGRVYAGVEYFIDDAHKISVRNLPPENGNIDLADFVKDANEKMNAVRHIISTKIFNGDAQEWNDSPIGRFLAFLSRRYREETYKEKNDGIYNIALLMSLSQACIGLAELCLSADFIVASHNKRMSILNSYANAESEAIARKSSLVKMSMVIELIIAIDDLKRSGRNLEVANLIEQVSESAKTCIAYFDEAENRAGAT